MGKSKDHKSKKATKFVSKQAVDTANIVVENAKLGNIDDAIKVFKANSRDSKFVDRVVKLFAAEPNHRSILDNRDFLSQADCVNQHLTNLQRTRTDAINRQTVTVPTTETQNRLYVQENLTQARRDDHVTNHKIVHHPHKQSVHHQTVIDERVHLDVQPYVHNKEDHIYSVSRDDTADAVKIQRRSTTVHPTIVDTVVNDPKTVFTLDFACKPGHKLVTSDTKGLQFATFVPKGYDYQSISDKTFAFLASGDRYDNEKGQILLDYYGRDDEYRRCFHDKCKKHNRHDLIKKIGEVQTFTCVKESVVDHKPTRTDKHYNYYDVDELHNFYTINKVHNITENKYHEHHDHHNPLHHHKIIDHVHTNNITNTHINDARQDYVHVREHHRYEPIIKETDKEYCDTDYSKQVGTVIQDNKVTADPKPAGFTYQCDADYKNTDAADVRVGQVKVAAPQGTLSATQLRVGGDVIDSMKLAAVRASPYKSKEVTMWW